jgi:hypothetical protein
MVNLDRVFFSLGWDEKFPLSMSWYLTRVGSDHSPVIVDNGESLPTRPRYFFFDQQWLQREDFRHVVDEYWRLDEGRCPETSYSFDCWHGYFVFSKTKLKGWNIGRLGGQKKKRNFMEEQANIDRQADAENLHLKNGLIDMKWRDSWSKFIWKKKYIGGKGLRYIG